VPIEHEGHPFALSNLRAACTSCNTARRNRFQAALARGDKVNFETDSWSPAWKAAEEAARATMQRRWGWLETGGEPPDEVKLTRRDRRAG
jgi:hypothetical protein